MNEAFGAHKADTSKSFIKSLILIIFNHKRLASVYEIIPHIFYVMYVLIIIKYARETEQCSISKFNFSINIIDEIIDLRLMNESNAAAKNSHN